MAKLLDLFDPVFGGDWLALMLPPPYRTADEVAEAIDRAWENRPIAYQDTNEE